MGLDLGRSQGLTVDELTSLYASQFDSPGSVIGGNRVVGFYSLSMGGVERGDAPRRLLRGLPRFRVPIVLLARLAIDESVQGQGLGMSLLCEALHRAGLAAEHAAARLVAVDPIDDRARSFYERCGFKPVDGDPASRLFVRTRDALVSFPGDYGTPPDR